MKFLSTRFYTSVVHQSLGTSRSSINYPAFIMKPNNKCKYIVQHIILTVIYAAHIKNDKNEKERKTEKRETMGIYFPKKSFISPSPLFPGHFFPRQIFSRA